MQTIQFYNIDSLRDTIKQFYKEFKVMPSVLAHDSSKNVFYGQPFIWFFCNVGTMIPGINELQRVTEFEGVDLSKTICVQCGYAYPPTDENALKRDLEIPLACSYCTLKSNRLMEVIYGNRKRISLDT